MFQQNVAEKNFWSSEKSVKARGCLAIAVSEEQISRRWQLGCQVNITNLEIKNLPKKSCFLHKSSQETRLKDFSGSPKVTKTLSRC